MLETYRPAPELLARARDWHMLSPWHEVLFGLDTQQEQLIDSGLAEATLGLSRNEFLRRKLEGEAAPRARVHVTQADWHRSAELFADLADPDVMDDAWR